MKPKGTSENRWKKLRDSFDKVISLDEEQRKNYVSELRFNEKTIFQELMELVEVQESGKSFLEEPALSVQTYLETENYVGESFGSYKITEEIGRGGMGAVFEAVRDDGEFEQRVAIKVTNRGFFNGELIKRFRNERQILAQLEHPNIVKLLDGGVTPQNTPFFVMEFIEGTPITEYFKEQKLNAEQVLNLFLDVCDAVSYAHSRLVVHRDLKPSNILVTSAGQVKLLDFGIAKIVDADSMDQTATRNAPLTPAYSSPEQIRGEIITTASDIFSLGILFYELMSGKTPSEFFGVSKTGMQRAICEQDVTRPSQNSADHAVLQELSRQRKTDLDIIAQKAMTKEPVGRYASVERFAEDVRFFLEGMPIRARPQSFSYRASKFIRRNRVLVLVSSVAILFTLIGTSVAIWQSVAARQQKEIAETRFKQVRRIANSLILEYHDEIAKLDGSTKLRERLVLDAVDYLDAISAEETANPELLKELGIGYRKIGDVQGQSYGPNLGKFDRAKRNYEKSAILLEKATDTDKSDVTIKVELMRTLDALATANIRTGKRNVGAEILNKAIGIGDSMITANPTEQTIALLLQNLKLKRADSEIDHKKRLDLYELCVKDSLRIFGTNPFNKEHANLLKKLYGRIGSNQRWFGERKEKSGHTKEAVRFFQEALKNHEKSLFYNQKEQELEGGIVNKRSMYVSYESIASDYLRLGKYTKAQEYLAIAEKHLNDLRKSNPNNRELDVDWVVLLLKKQQVFSGLGRMDEAAEYITAALSLGIRSYESNTSDVEMISWIGALLQDMAKLQNKLGNPQEAKKYSRLFDKYQLIYQSKFGRDWEFNY